MTLLLPAKEAPENWCIILIIAEIRRPCQGRGALRASRRSLELGLDLRRDRAGWAGVSGVTLRSLEETARVAWSHEKVLQRAGADYKVGRATVRQWSRT